MNNAQTPKLKVVAKRKRQPARNKKVSMLIARSSHRRRLRRKNYLKYRKQKGA